LSFIKSLYQKNIQEPLQTSIGKGVYLIAKGTILAQCITLISTPIITRLFSPSDFGIFALYSSVLTILIVFGTGKYEFAIPLPKEEEKALHLIILACILIIIIGGIFSITVWLFGNDLLTILKISEIKPFLIILIISFFCASIYQVLNYWAIRTKNYHIIGKTIISKNISGSGSKIFLGLINFKVIGLIIGDLISQIIGIYSIFIIFWKKHSTDLKEITAKGILDTAREYYRFPAFSLPSMLFNTLAFQLPILLLVSYYGTTTAGLYSIAFGVLALPVTILSSSISQVYLGEISSLLQSDPGKIRKLYQTAIIRIAIIAIPVIAIIALLAPFIFPVIFGEAWKEAGFFCIALGIMLVFQVCFSTVSILHYCGLNSWVLGFDILRTSLIFAIFLFSMFMHFSAFVAIFLYSTSMGLLYILNYWMNLKAMSYLERQI
jgi:O-antigen/teichoic acid export membrane protein